MLTWHYLTRSIYDGMTEAQKSLDCLYFIKYGDRIYNGPNTFNEYIVVYNTNPGTSTVGKVYINKNDLYGQIWDGNVWTQIINPVIKTGEDIFNATDVTTLKYDSTYNNFKVIATDNTEYSIEFEDMYIDIAFGTGGPVIKDSWAYLDNGKKIDISALISRISYNNNISRLEFLFDTMGLYRWEVSFDANTISRVGADTVTITGNEFIAECTGYYNEASLIEKGTNGIYTVYRVDGGDTDITAMDMVQFAMTSIVATAAEMTDVMYTVGFGHTNEVLIADDIGRAKASGVELVTEVSPVPDNYHLPTEKAIYDFLDGTIIEAKDVTPAAEFAQLTLESASETKIPSEKAILNKLKWKIV